MTEARSFLKEIDEAILQGTAESRARALWYATDLLIEGRYAEDQIWIFGEVIGRLADEIEVAARAQLAVRLARTVHAPANIVRKLAFDDSIEVAGPVLEHSERLDSRTLVSNIRTKSQSHLLAISKRCSLQVEVTDELVTRGNQEVLNSVAANDGACVSNFGFLHMIKRSGNDSVLAERLGLRKDIPRQMFQQLIAKASADVKRKLEEEHPDLAEQIQASVADVAGSLQSKFGPATSNYLAAKKAVAARHQHGELDEDCILDYARSHRIEEATVGLSLLCSLPVDVAERALADREMTLILAKARDFGWETTMALLFLTARDYRINAQALEDAKREYARLDIRTSREVLNFYQSRRSAASAELDQSRLPQLHAH